MAFRCFLPAWIMAWVTAVFLPSVLIAYFGISQAAAKLGTGFDRLPATTWKVAADVGPVVKLMIGGLLLVGLLGLTRMGGLSSGARSGGSAAAGLIAVTATIALVPSALSRGFAGASTGTPLDRWTTPIYLLGGALAGLAFVWSSDRCARGSAGRRTGAPLRR